MLNITPNFHFNGQCKQAIKLYEKAFDAQIKELLCYCDADPKDFINDKDEYKDHVYHSEIIIGNQRIFLSDSNENTIPVGSLLSLVITFDTMEDVKTAYDILSDAAMIVSPMHSSTYSSCFVSLIDKYGMRWELMTEQAEK